MAVNSPDRFLAEVEKLRSPQLMRAHKEFLWLIEAAAAHLWADFNVEHSDDKDYQIKMVGLDEHIFRVAASGKLFAFWNPLRKMPGETFAVYKNAMKPWVKNGSNVMGSQLKKPIDQLDLPALMADFKAALTSRPGHPAATD